MFEIEDAIDKMNRIATLYKNSKEWREDSVMSIDECDSCAEEHTQIAEWLRELKRLQSLEWHKDYYETSEYLFSYDESYITSISVWDIERSEVIEMSTLSEPLSHEEFVNWCKTWIIRKKYE